MDWQKTFDKVLTEVTKQGKLSLEGKSCKYFSSDGCKCSIGHLILPEHYDASIEGKSIWQMHHEKGLAPIEKLLGEDLNYADIRFLAALQGAHDGATSIDHFKQMMAMIAKEQNLKM